MNNLSWSMNQSTLDTVKTIYPNFSGTGDYQPMLASFGKLLLQVDDDDYQGDSRVLYSDHGEIGLLIFGWGSCCGCDALQACDTIEQVAELYEELQSSIIWLPVLDMLNYLENHDWEGDFSWRGKETREFVAQAKRILKGILYS